MMWQAPLRKILNFGPTAVIIFKSKFNSGTGAPCCSTLPGEFSPPLHVILFPP
uniref:Uncharacterized protein n=1 Tax=Triticum urartu TaxID=4572 RepID=A0A8R7QZY5_TRIUA